MADKQLHVYMDGVRAGAVYMTSSGALSFTYDDTYRKTPGATQVAPLGAQLQQHTGIRMRQQQSCSAEAPPVATVRAVDPRVARAMRPSGSRIVGSPGHASSLCRAAPHRPG